jgi:hypothetical protein
MTRDGAILWLPSGIFPAGDVITNPHSMDIRLDHDGGNIFAFHGWPTIDCQFRSDDGDLQADLRFVLNAVTTLPDCMLPHCLFAMWESMGDVHGSVRYQDRAVEVKGKVFFDHTRVIPRRHALLPRHMYVYTTLYFEDGSGFFGYHSVDADGRVIDGYCFGIHLDASGKGRFLTDVRLDRLLLDSDEIAKSWRIRSRTQEFSLNINVTVQDTRIARCWGSSAAPQTRREFSIIPLVLDGTVQIAEVRRTRTLKAYGLAEFFSADLWPPDKAATSVAPSPPSWATRSL